MLNKCLTALALAAALLPAAHADPVVYNQSWDHGTWAWSSQNDPGGAGDFAKVYDNFTLAASTAITGIDWVGAYLSQVQGTPTGFLLQIWADQAGAPGSLLYSDTISGNAHQSAGLVVGAWVYQAYSEDLATAFQAAAGVTYWLSVQEIGPVPTQWAWGGGSGGDGSEVQDFAGTRYVRGNDAAFDLRGGTATVPEPGSLALAGLALLGLGAGRRRARTG